MSLDNSEAPKPKKKKDRRFLSSAVFTLLLVLLGTLFGYFMPNLDPSKLYQSSYWQAFVWLGGPVICMIYYSL